MGARLVDEALARSRAHGAAVTGDAAPGGEDGLGIAAGNGPPVNPDAGNNEQQELGADAPGPFTGTFKIGFGGQETPAIDVEVTTASEIVAMLEALSTIGAGNIEDVSGNGPDVTFADTGGFLMFEFVGDLAAQDVALLEVVDLDVLSDGNPIAPEAFVFEANDGVPGTLGTPPSPTDGQLYLDLDASALYEYRASDGFWLDVAQYAVDGHAAIVHPHAAYMRQADLAEVAGLIPKVDGEYVVDIVTFGGILSNGTVTMPRGFVFDGVAAFVAEFADGGAVHYARFSMGSDHVARVASTEGIELLAPAIGFYGATPVAQPAPVADAITAVDVILRFNELMARLRTTGLIDT